MLSVCNVTAVTEAGRKANLEDSDEDEGNYGRERHVEESEGDREGEAEVFLGQDVLRKVSDSMLPLGLVSREKE